MNNWRPEEPEREPAGGDAGESLALLGLKADASWAQICRTYRRLARACHPDLAGGDPAAARRLQALNSAFQTLQKRHRRGPLPVPATPEHKNLLPEHGTSAAAPSGAWLVRGLRAALVLAVLVALALGAREGWRAAASSVTGPIQRTEGRQQASRPRTLQAAWGSSRLTAYEMASVRVTLTDAPHPPGEVVLDVTGPHGTVTLQLEAVPGMAVWAGRFTPTVPGRYVGVALWKGPGGELLAVGLPEVAASPSAARGYLRLHSDSRRVLAFQDGSTLFPNGIRVDPESASELTSWIREIALWQEHGVNLLEVRVPWGWAPPPMTLQGAYSETTAAAAPTFRVRSDTLEELLEVLERRGGPVALLRFEPDPAGKATPLQYAEQALAWVRRWCPATAVAGWYLEGAGPGISEQERTAIVASVRAADPYGHLIAIPAESRHTAGADLLVTSDSSRVAARLPLLHLGRSSARPALVEHAYHLVHGDLGLPLLPFALREPPGAGGAPDARNNVLRHLRFAGNVARTVPYRAPMRALPSGPGRGRWMRYGSVLLGWVRTGPRGTLPGLESLGEEGMTCWLPGHAATGEQGALSAAERSGLPVGTQLLVRARIATRDAPPTAQQAPRRAASTP